MKTILFLMVACAGTVVAGELLDEMKDDQLRRNVRDIKMNQMMQNSRLQALTEDQQTAVFLKGAMSNDTDAVRKLQAKNTELVKKYNDLVVRYNAISEAEEAKFKEEVAFSQKKAAKEYPAILDPNSALSKKVDEIFARLESQNNDLVYEANAPFIITQMAASDLGIEPQKP